MTDMDVGSTTQELRFGRDDDDDPAANAVVRVQVGPWLCTATLIAPDLVLTAGHCVEDHGRAVRDPWPAPAGTGCTDDEVPGRWYPAGPNIASVPRVEVGQDREEVSFATTATDYTIPGCADIIVLRLAQPVPEALATPVKVLASLGAESGANDAGALRAEELVAVGWGPTAERTSSRRYRQVGTTTYLRHDEHKLYTGGADDDAAIVGGDSGGPLLWTHRSGQRYVVSVTQGNEGRDGRVGRHTPTFGNPARAGGDHLLPGVGDFFTLVVPEAVADEAALRGPAGTVALSAWWSPGRQDNQLTTDPRMIGAAGTRRGPDYAYVGCEGHVFHPGLPAPRGTVPLHRWWDPERGDNHTSSEAFMARWPGDRWHRDPGYGYSRLEGYVYSVEYPQPPGTVPLMKWWSPSRADNHTTTRFADLAARGEGLGPDYVRPRVIGYVLPA